MPSIEESIQYRFRDPELLREALTHKSYACERHIRRYNERLEFLGDAILNSIVADYLYRTYPSMEEGDLTKIRSRLVNRKALAQRAKELRISEFLLLSSSAVQSVDSGSDSILADAFEAIIGAIYLDRGYDAAKKFISENILSRLEEVIKRKLYIDPKSNFQEESQARAGITPNYRVISESGPDHDKKFIVGVYLEDEEVARGEGNSKQQAQREAARAGLEAKGW